MIEQGSSSRASGILLHPTSLPSAFGIGDLGKCAYEFVDFLADTGQKLWQLLPLGPTGYGDSPYQSFSAFAGQTLLITPNGLIEDGLLTMEDLKNYPVLPDNYVDYGAVLNFKNKLFELAYSRFQTLRNTAYLTQFQQFCDDNCHWLSDYSLYMVLKEKNNQLCWLEWPLEHRRPTPEVKLNLHKQFKQRIQYYQFVQFVFFKQWFSLKKYANDHGIRIIGDIPIFVSLDSSDVWAHPSLFQLDEQGIPTFISGVPPDYFSAQGQLWGNPLYDWEVQEKDNYSWWISRIEAQMKLVDIIRIDHFRGFDSYWAVPYGSATAVNGHWCSGPKDKLFLAISKAFGDKLHIWAEDLGIITDDVRALRDRLGLPGMKVLQFAFEQLEDNDLMPEHHINNCICYTGTHDNDTTLGWYYSLPDDKKKHVREYMHCGGALMNWALIRTALESRADNTILPMQDILSLGSEARMNKPGSFGCNWSWRYRPEMLDKDWTAYLKELTVKSGR